MGVELILIASLVLIAYVYVGYPALAFVLGRLLARPVRRAEITPKVSFVIAARNEERDIAAKVENTLALDYPPEKLEVIVASDCSSDRTDEIVRGYAGRGVILRRRAARSGKTAAQAQAVRASSGEVLVLSDATTMCRPDALRKIVRSFADTEVGCVAGQLIYVDPAATAVGRGCRSYWGYEKVIKQSESRLGSLIGVSGCLYAIRRSSFTRLPFDMIDDFVVATEIHLQGLRTVYEPEAVAAERTNRHGREEFRMRVRIIVQTMNALYRYREVLSLRRHGLFAFQMISHKVLRYAVPVLLAVAFAASAMLAAAAPVYALACAGQAALYLAALAGWAADRVRIRLGPLALPYYFVLANAAVVIAALKFFRGETQAVWTPVREA